MGCLLSRPLVQRCSFVLFLCTKTSLCQITEPALTGSPLGLGCCWGSRKATLTDPPGTSPVPSAHGLLQWDAVCTGAGAGGAVSCQQRTRFGSSGIHSPQHRAPPHHDSLCGKPTPQPPGPNWDCHLWLMSPFLFHSPPVLSPGGFQQRSEAWPLPLGNADVGAGIAALLCSPAPPGSSSPLSCVLTLPCRGTGVLQGCCR